MLNKIKMKSCQKILKSADSVTWDQERFGDVVYKGHFQYGGTQKRLRLQKAPFQRGEILDLNTTDLSLYSLFFLQYDAAQE